MFIRAAVNQNRGILYATPDTSWTPIARDVTPTVDALLPSEHHRNAEEYAKQRRFKSAATFAGAYEAATAGTRTTLLSRPRADVSAAHAGVNRRGLSNVEGLTGVLKNDDKNCDLIHATTKNNNVLNHTRLLNVRAEGVTPLARGVDPRRIESIAHGHAVTSVIHPHAYNAVTTRYAVQHNPHALSRVPISTPLLPEQTPSNPDQSLNRAQGFPLGIPKKPDDRCTTDAVDHLERAVRYGAVPAAASASQKSLQPLTMEKHTFKASEKIIMTAVEAGERAERQRAANDRRLCVRLKDHPRTASEAVTQAGHRARRECAANDGTTYVRLKDRPRTLDEANHRLVRSVVCVTKPSMRRIGRPITIERHTFKAPEKIPTTAVEAGERAERQRAANDRRLCVRLKDHPRAMIGVNAPKAQARHVALSGRVDSRAAPFTGKFGTPSTQPVIKQLSGDHDPWRRSLIACQSAAHRLTETKLRPHKIESAVK